MGKDICPGLKAGRRGTFGGQRAPGRNHGGVPARGSASPRLLVLPRHRDGAHSACFDHVQVANSTSWGNHQTRALSQPWLEPLFTPWDEAAPATGCHPGSSSSINTAHPPRNHPIPHLPNPPLHFLTGEQNHPHVVPPLTPLL